MHKLAAFVAVAILGGLSGPALGQIVVTGSRSVAVCPSVRVAPDDGRNIRNPRRERNPYFAARPVYPSTPLGARASINFAPYTSKYYPREGDSYPPQLVVPTTRRR